MILILKLFLNKFTFPITNTQSKLKTEFAANK
jgi:hypothetical protein